MPTQVDFHGWDPADALDTGAREVLAFLERLELPPSSPDPIQARVDEHGVATGTIALPSGATLHVQGGDGWNRVLWTTPEQRTYEWTWDATTSPPQIEALIDGRATERVWRWRGREITADLVADDVVVASQREGHGWWLPRRLATRGPDLPAG